MSHLSTAEMTFLFCMLRKYSDMPEPVLNEESKNKKKKNHNYNKKKSRYQKPVKSKQSSSSEYPDLCNFDDPKWKTCTDEKFLQYREIIKKTEE